MKAHTVIFLLTLVFSFILKSHCVDNVVRPADWCNNPWSQILRSGFRGKPVCENKELPRLKISNALGRSRLIFFIRFMQIPKNFPSVVLHKSSQAKLCIICFRSKISKLIY